MMMMIKMMGFRWLFNDDVNGVKTIMKRCPACPILSSCRQYCFATTPAYDPTLLLPIFPVAMNGHHNTGAVSDGK